MSNIDLTSGARRRTAAAVLATLLLSACGQPATVEARTPPRTVATASPTGTPTPTASPTPSRPSSPPVVRVASSTKTTSTHWAGYTFPIDSTGVRAEWIEPTVTGKPVQEEFIWVGIGGWDYTVQNIVQVGTFAYFPEGAVGGGPNQGIWYQYVPTLQTAQFPLIDVRAGDRIFASVEQTGAASASMWTMTLRDLTSGDKYVKVVRFHSLHAYPTVVVEDPNTGALGPDTPVYPFPRWSPVRFTAVEVLTRGHWVPAATVSGLRIDMVQNGRTLATTGAMNADSGFTCTRR